MRGRRILLGLQALQLARSAASSLPAGAREPVRAGMQALVLGVGAAACAGLAWLALIAAAIVAIVGGPWWLALAVAGGLMAGALGLGLAARTRARAVTRSVARLGARPPRTGTEDDVVEGVARPVGRETDAP